MTTVVPSVPKGAAFGRYCKALLLARGDPLNAAAYAEGRGPAWREVGMALRSVVTPMTAAGNATSIAYPIAYDFAEMLRPLTVIGRMVGLHRVPFNLITLATVTGAGATWVGEGLPIPASALDFDKGTTLTFAKVSSLVIETLELIRSSTPNIESILSADVARAAAFAIDLAFLSPENSGSAGIRPASITFGGSAFITSTGSAIANIDVDLRSALSVLNNGNVDLSTAVWCMAPHTAVYLSTLRGSGGANAYPLVTARGGFLLGLPILTSNAIGQDSNSPSETFIALIAASEVLLADDGASTVEVSDQASIQADDAPTTSNGSSAIVSLWQNNLASLKASRVVNWQRRRTAGVAVISEVPY